MSRHKDQWRPDGAGGGTAVVSSSSICEEALRHAINSAKEIDLAPGFGLSSFILQGEQPAVKTGGMRIKLPAARSRACASRQRLRGCFGGWGSEQPLGEKFAETIALVIKNHLNAASLRQVAYLILVVAHCIRQNLRVY